MARALLSRQGLSVGRPTTFGDSPNIDMSMLMNIIHPIGSILMLADQTDPHNIIGFEGTSWDKIPEDCFLYTGAESLGDDSSNETSGSTVLTETQIPGHKHTIGGHTHTVAAHKHSIADHSHTVDSHTHGMTHNHTSTSHTHTFDHTHGLNHGHRLGEHTHGIADHKHDIDAHVHAIDGHTHTLNSHTHGIDVNRAAFRNHTHIIGSHTHNLGPIFKGHTHSMHHVHKITKHDHAIWQHAHVLGENGGGFARVMNMLSFGNHTAHIEDAEGTLSHVSVNNSYRDSGPGSSHTRSQINIQIDNHNHTVGLASYLTGQEVTDDFPRTLPNNDSDSGGPSKDYTGNANYSHYPNDYNTGDVYLDLYTQKWPTTGEAIGDGSGEVDFHADTESGGSGSTESGGSGRTTGSYVAGQATDGSGYTSNVSLVTGVPTSEDDPPSVIDFEGNTGNASTNTTSGVAASIADSTKTDTDSSSVSVNNTTLATNDNTEQISGGTALTTDSYGDSLGHSHSINMRRVHVSAWVRVS